LRSKRLKQIEQIETDRNKFYPCFLKVYGKPVPNSRGLKNVNIKDSKSRGPQAHVGSIPTSGTNYSLKYIFPAIPHFSSAFTDFLLITDPSKKLP
jgi:hypothetical protein